MHIHNVADYAPAGHKLLRTEYAEGKTRHVFDRIYEDDRGPGTMLVCEVPAGTAESERAALEAFMAEWTPLESTPVPALGVPEADQPTQGRGQAAKRKAKRT
jgi:hypothetical protein